MRLICCIRRSYIMRVLLFVATLLFCLSSYAFDIKCYSKGQLLYKGQADDLAWEEPFVTFIDRDSKKYLAIKGDCVIKLA